MKRHPLEITYDELQRSVTRLENYKILLDKSKVNEINDVEQQINLINHSINLIPDAFRNTYYKIQQRKGR